MRYKITTVFDGDPTTGTFMLIGDDTIVTTPDDNVLNFMFDSHLGVSTAILACKGEATQIGLYRDSRAPSGFMGTTGAIPERYEQVGRIELLPNA